MLGESAGRAERARVRPNARRRMDEGERTERTPIMDDGTVTPDDIKTGGWTMKSWTAYASIILVHTIIMIGARTLVDLGGTWGWFGWLFISIYSGLAVTFGWAYWYASTRRPPKTF